jgi:hypothetical protein
MPSGSAGLVGSINPSLPIDLTPISSGGNPLAGYGSFTSSPINIMSPGATTAASAASGLSTGTIGVLLFIGLGIVGVILLFTGKA